MMRHRIAHLFTVGNLFCGFLSIVMVLDGHGALAAWLIFCAALLDAFDGKIARFTRSESAFGLQFDSLADVVSFGVAPGILIYLLAFQEHGVLGIFVSFIPVLFTAIRLARFNQKKGKGASHEYEGLSSPFQACLVASFIIMNLSVWETVRSDMVLAGFVILLGLLMISHFPLPGLPRITLREPGYNLAKLLVLIGSIVFIAINPSRHIFPVAVLVTVAAFIVGALRSSRRDDIEYEEDEAGAQESEAPVPGGDL